FLAARTARRAGAYDDAERHLRAYQQLDAVPEALELERALLRVQRGDTTSFESYLLACGKKDHPDSLLILEALLKGYIKTYRLSRAAYFLSLWLEREPTDVQALLWRGEVAERRQSSEAADFYRRAAEADPEHEEARLHLADALVRLRRYAEAEK